jgi:L-rhamnose mutarotase
VSSALSLEIYLLAYYKLIHALYRPIGTLRDGDFDETWARIEADPVNTRWQQAMALYFAPLDPALDPLHPGERFPMLREVFYMP